MPRDYSLYLQDILEAIKRIENYVQGYSYGRFSGDKKTSDAVIRNLEIIGEASKKIPNDIKTIQSSVDWRKISSLRDILIHEYFGIDMEILWDIVQTKLSSLKSAIQEIQQKKKS